MSQQIQTIHPRSALQHGFRRPDNFLFAKQQPALAVYLPEISSLAATLPLAFAKLAESNFSLVAVTGFADGRNLLVDDNGRWGGLYMPNHFRVYPFSLQTTVSQKQDEFTFAVCFDHASALYREAPNLQAGDLRFFDDEGQAQPLFKQVTEQLKQNVLNQQHTQRAVDALFEAKLLTPWQIKAKDGHPECVLPKGLYRVDEDKLNELKGQALEKLHQVNALALAYGQLLSMSRVVVLQRLKEAHQANAIRQQNSTPAKAADPSIVQQLFGGAQGDTMKFNF